MPIARGDYALATWKEDLDYAIAAIRARAPQARVILATLANAAYSPGLTPGGWDALPQLMRARVAEAANAMNAYFLSLPYDVVDLRCDPKMYDPTLLFQDGSKIVPFHFGDEGDAYLAQHFYRVVNGRGDARRSSCAPYTLVPPVDRWYEGFVSASQAGS